MTPQFIDTISNHVLRRTVSSPSTWLLIPFAKTHYLDTGGTTFHRSAQHDLRVLWSFQLYCRLPNPHWVWYVFKSYGEWTGTNTWLRLDGLRDGMGIIIMMTTTMKITTIITITRTMTIIIINSYSSRTRRIWADIYNQRDRRPSWLLSAHIRQVREE